MAATDEVIKATQASSVVNREINGKFHEMSVECMEIGNLRLIGLNPPTEFSPSR